MIDSISKKIVLLIYMILSAVSLWSQDTVSYPYYRYMDALYNAGEEYGFEGIPLVVEGSRCFQGMEYISNGPQVVYGVAIAISGVTHTNDPLSVRIAQKTAGVWRFMDSVQWLERSPDRYITFHLGQCNPLSWLSIIPVYEIYFNHTIDVFDTFAVGSGYYYSDRNISPALGGAPIFLSVFPCDNDERRYIYLNSHDGDSMLFSEGDNARGLLCMFPIIVPPDTDSYVCAGVDSVRVQGSGTGWVNVAWAPGSSDQDLFQIAYGVRGEDPERYASVTNLESPRVIFDDAIDTGVYYSVRVRGRCHHRCAVHDTLMWGPWSDPVHFYVGNHEPGTGIAAPAETPAFTLSPNPAKGMTVVSSSYRLTRIRAYNMQGQLVLDQRPSLSQSATLDLTAWPKGTYLLRITTLAGIVSKKLLVE